jgi:hypothetical protein
MPLSQEQLDLWVQVRTKFLSYVTSTKTDRVLAERSIDLIHPAHISQHRRNSIHWVRNPAAGWDLCQELEQGNHLIHDADDLVSCVLLPGSYPTELLGQTCDELMRPFHDDLCKIDVPPHAKDPVPSLSVLNNTAQVAGYQFFSSLPGVKTTSDAVRLGAAESLFQSAFAVWLPLDHVILCEKPTYVVPEHGTFKLIFRD